jgi:hypothetical protein
MQAWMILKNPIDISAFDDVHIGLKLYCLTDPITDFFELFLLDNEDHLVQGPRSLCRLTGNADYNLRYWAAPVDSFQIDLSDHSLRFALLFYSNGQNTESGVSISQVKVFGSRRL